MDKEMDSIKYNRTILEKRIGSRFYLLIFAFVFAVCLHYLGKNKTPALLGAVMSLIVTILYSLIDLYYNIYEEIDNQREKFKVDLYEKIGAFTKVLKERVLPVLEQVNKEALFRELTIERQYSYLASNLEFEETCKHIEEISNYVIVTATNKYTIYTLTKEFFKIDKYVKQIFTQFESIKLIGIQENKVDWAKNLILIEQGINEDLNKANIKAEEITKKSIEETDANDFKYFTHNDNRGDIIPLLQLDLCISNKMKREIDKLMFEMDDDMHKKEARRLFFDSIKNRTSNIMKKFLKMLKKVFITLFLLLLLLLIIGLAEGFFIWH